LREEVGEESDASTTQSFSRQSEPLAVCFRTAVHHSLNQIQQFDNRWKATAMIYLPPQESSHSEVHRRYCSARKPLAMAMAWKRSSGEESRGKDDARGGGALRFFYWKIQFILLIIGTVDHTRRWSEPLHMHGTRRPFVLLHKDS
jgi:hypothetical protein